MLKIKYKLNSGQVPCQYTQIFSFLENHTLRNSLLDKASLISNSPKDTGLWFKEKKERKMKHNANKDGYSAWDTDEAHLKAVI